MSPGPKKRNASRREPQNKTSDGGKYTRNNSNTQTDTGIDMQFANNKQEPSEKAKNNHEEIYKFDDVKLGHTTENLPTSGKYKNRSIKSNWNRYDEPVPNIYEDRLRGDDYEVLLSYSGGASSQLRLQDEKDWEGDTEECHLSFNCDSFANALKCIPLHKRLNLREDAFTPEMICRFQKIAENYYQHFNTPRTEYIMNIADMNAVNLNIAEENEDSEDSSNSVKPNPQIISEATGSLIESLTSCLTIKEKSEKSESLLSCLTLKEESEQGSHKLQEPSILLPETSSGINSSNQSCTDDLDFLLSLKIPSIVTNTPLQGNETKAPKTSIDDWLNSILED